MLYEVTLRQSYYNQLCINRFHYNSGGTPAAVSGSFALAFAFGAVQTGEPPLFPSGSLLQLIRGIQAISLSYQEVEVRALYDVLDFYTRPFPGVYPGLSGGEAAAPFLATGFKSNRVRTDVGRGFKRFAGITESAMVPGGLIDAGVLASLTPLANKLGAVLEYVDEGNTITFAPVVLSYEDYVTPAGRRAYRPYATLAAQLDHTAQGVVYQAMPAVRSQVSRQYGRGQ